MDMLSGILARSSGVERKNSDFTVQYSSGWTLGRWEGEQEAIRV
jgi:hypothetical protein